MAKNSEQNNAPVEKQQVVDSRIAAVRDLIFGENIQQYDSEFADVYDKIKALQDESKKNLSESVTNIENKLADLESLMEHKIQDLSDDLEKKLADLDDEKADRKKLGKALEKIALMLQE
jgi:vacuolar-type H+-ATPase subunit I/STV1